LSINKPYPTAIKESIRLVDNKAFEECWVTEWMGSIEFITVDTNKEFR
jgi:hypothetical protein